MIQKKVYNHLTNSQLCQYVSDGYPNLVEGHDWALSLSLNICLNTYDKLNNVKGSELMIESSKGCMIYIYDNMEVDACDCVERRWNWRH